MFGNGGIIETLEICYMFFSKNQELRTTTDQKLCNRFFLKRSFFVYIIIILVIASFSIGVLVGKKKGDVNIISAPATIEYGEVKDKENSIPEYLGSDVNFRVFWQAWNEIQNTYIDAPVGETKLFYGALRGMVAALEDPYSVFMAPKKATEYIEELQGRFEGIGCEIGIRNNMLTVVSPLPESPAERAGLRAGDIIVEIEHIDTGSMDLSEAVARIRGDKGSTVTLKIYRLKTKEFLEVPIVRDTIRIISVQKKTLDGSDYAELGDKKIAVIKITNFNGDTESRFAQAVNDVLLENPNGLILDLRSNPGGYLDGAINVADYWLEQGKVVVREKSSAGESQMHMAPSLAKLDKFTTVILINAGSASASEIVAGALQDHGVATIIGETSFGKGSVQRVVDGLEDGSAIKLTIARWLTPNGRQIDMKGIEPDIPVELTLEDYNGNKDPQMDRAVQFFVQGE
ncbi:MAG: S41 family peptidase [Candidatus Kuenenbacteria bacterium]